MIDLSGLVAQVCNIAVDTGAFLREQRAAFDRSVVREKGPHDYVSYVDKASERRLVEALAALLPQWPRGAGIERTCPRTSDETSEESS